jgi:hypothetical protein
VQQLNNTIENNNAVNAAYTLFSTTAATGFGTAAGNNTQTLSNGFLLLIPAVKYRYAGQ